MSPIEVVYKTMYNYFVKKDGYNRTSHVIAGAATFLCNISFLLSSYCIINVIVNHSISLPFDKDTGRLIAIPLLMILNHLLLFNVLKFDKNGDMANNLFNLDKKTYSLGWWIFGVNLLVGVIVPTVSALFFI